MLWKIIVNGDLKMFMEADSSKEAFDNYYYYNLNKNINIDNEKVDIERYDG